MMLCPVCGRSYEAGTLFCMDDGTALVASGPPPSASGELGRILAVPANVAPPPHHVPPHHAAPAPARTGGLVSAVVLLGVLVVGMLGFMMWQQKQTADAAAIRAAEAEQRADDAQRTADAATNAAADAALQARDAAERAQSTAGDLGGTTVWAHSPNDGFLALRSAPTTAGGTRLLKIPHGDPLTLGGCTAQTTSPGGRVGSWCRAEYNGMQGWVFDAFVTR